MNLADRRGHFRGVLAGDACVYPASVFDPISARIAADLGYEMGMLAGSVASLAVLGAPDLIVLTLTEFAEQARRIARASDLPLMVDADHGYGNALNVMRTVQELETAGVAGLSIEDTLLPTPFGEVGTTRLVSIEEGVGKMRAALTARSDASLAIFGRTGAMALAGVDEAIARVRAYAACGVDAVFLTGVKERAQLDALAEAKIGVPMMLGGVPAELADRAYLAARGVRICLQGHQPFMAAVRAVYETLSALRADTPPGALHGVASDDMIRKWSHDSSYKIWMQQFFS
jgi:carboxyvinyl-carboxyphosphonate phosphorylmutase